MPTFHNFLFYNYCVSNIVMSEIKSMCKKGFDDSGGYSIEIL